jgi:SAM-dependent methyltransferase
VASTATDSNSERRPHAVLDLPSRRWKALKIERLLGLDQGNSSVRMLEIGTGSGGIANYFGTHPSGRYTVDAVDVVDNRLVTVGYVYTQVSDARLPFPDRSFDVVLTNHVIEHVGDESAQRVHLAEIRRVLREGGVCYLAVPNRWMLVEPHYQLIFLSWLPVSWRSPYLRASGKGEQYDCRPLQPRQLERMLAQGDFRFQNLCLDALRVTFEIERSGTRSGALLARIPNAWLRPATRLIPTLIYKLWLPDSPASARHRADG